MSVIDTILIAVIATISVAPEIHGITSSIDGSKLYVTSWNVNDIMVIDSSTLTVTASIPLGAGRIRNRPESGWYEVIRVGVGREQCCHSGYGGTDNNDKDSRRSQPRSPGDQS